MVRNLTTLIFLQVSILVLAWVAMTNGLSLEDRLQQLTQQVVRITTRFSFLLFMFNFFKFYSD